MKNVLTPKFLAFLSAFIIFILDLFFPPETAIGGFYLISLVIVLNESRKAIIVCAIICSFLTIADTLISHTDFYRNIIHYELSIYHSVYFERELTILGISLVCVILVKYRKLNEEKIERQEKNIQSLEQMIDMTSHKVNQPITQIIGLSNELDESVGDPEELKKVVGFMKQSALNLELFTHELNRFIIDEKEKHRNEN